MIIASDEHVIKCSLCGRDLAVRDNVNNGVAFLSHLKVDHHIRYTAQQMTAVRPKLRNNATINQQMLEPQERRLESSR